MSIFHNEVVVQENSWVSRGNGHNQESHLRSKKPLFKSLSYLCISSLFYLPHVNVTPQFLILHIHVQESTISQQFQTLEDRLYLTHVGPSVHHLAT